MTTVKNPANPVNSTEKQAEKPQTGLARRVEPIVGELVISDPRELTSRFLTLKDRANLITPVVEVSSIAQNHVVNIGIVQIDPTVDANGNGQHCYRDKTFMAENERGLNRAALDMIASAAGVSWAPYPLSRRTDDGSHPHKWQYQTFGAYTAMDGTVQSFKGESLVDLSDGSEQIGGWSQEAWDKIQAENKGKPKDKQTWHINGWSDKRVRQARRFGLQLAETKARLRAIRTMGVKQKYTLEELKKPFALPRVSFQPDMSVPAIADAIVRQKSLGAAALFAQITQPALPPHDAATAIHRSLPAHVEDLPAELGGGTAAAESQPQPTGLQDAGDLFKDEPAETKPKGFKVEEVGYKGSDYWIRVEGNETPLYTADKALAKACYEAKKAGKQLDISAEFKAYPGVDADWKGKDVYVIVEISPVDEGL